MFIFFSERITRRAISPLLATKTFFMDSIEFAQKYDSLDEDK